MKTAKIVRRRRSRKTVAAEVITPQPASILGSFAQIAEALKAAGMQIVPFGGSSAVVPATVTPVSPAPVSTIPPPRPRKLYSINPNPSPFNPGEAVQKVYAHLTKHGETTQRKLEEGTGLSEGQIKGALRELRLGGFLLDREEPTKGS